MKNEDYALISSADLDRVLFTVAAMLGRNSILQIVDDDQKYERFQSALLDLRLALRVAKKRGRQAEFSVDDSGSAS